MSDTRSETALSTDVIRPVSEPNLGDAQIVDHLDALNRVLALVSRLRAAGDDPDPYYPDEIISYIDYDMVETAWQYGYDDIIRREYVKAWMALYEDILGQPTYYTVEEFLDGSVTF